MEINRKICVMDFDGTIIHGNSYEKFVRFMLIQNNIFYLLIVLLTYVLRKFNIVSSKKGKEVILSPLKGRSMEKINQLGEKFFEKYLKNIIYNDAAKLINDKLNNGFEVVIISGAFEFYLNNLKKSFPGINCYGSKLIFNENVFTGKIDKELLGLNKLDLFASIYGPVQIDEFYSDSLTDLPLFNISSEKFLINYRTLNSQINLSTYNSISWS